jgi:hypothetical protein
VLPAAPPAWLTSTVIRSEVDRQVASAPDTGADVVDIGAPGFGLVVTASWVVAAAWDVLAEAQDASRTAAATAVTAVAASDAARRPRRP